MKVAVYNKDKEEVKTISLDEGVFNVKINPEVVHEVVRIMRGNIRKPIAHAKGRGEVSGGGKKPWRQKGTGRARHGSIRSPLWRKGGVTHGPLKDRVFKASINKKTKLKALTMILSGKVQKGLLYVVTDDTVSDFSKTKSAQLFANNFLKQGKRFSSGILVHTFADTKLARGIRNLSCLRWLPSSGLNIMDLVNTNYMIATESSINQIISSFKKS